MSSVRPWRSDVGLKPDVGLEDVRPQPDVTPQRPGRDVGLKPDVRLQPDVIQQRPRPLGRHPEVHEEH
jgi:hypothetical protein